MKREESGVSLYRSDCCHIQVLLSEEALFCNCFAAVGCPCPQRGVFYIYQQDFQEQCEGESLGLVPVDTSDFSSLWQGRTSLGKMWHHNSTLCLQLWWMGTHVPHPHLWLRCFWGVFFIQCVTQLWQSLVHQINRFILPPVFCSGCCWQGTEPASAGRDQTKGRALQGTRVPHCTRAWAALPGEPGR